MATAFARCRWMGVGVGDVFRPPGLAVGVQHMVFGRHWSPAISDQKPPDMMVHGWHGKKTHPNLNFWSPSCDEVEKRSKPGNRMENPSIHHLSKCELFVFSPTNNLKTQMAWVIRPPHRTINIKKPNVGKYTFLRLMDGIFVRLFFVAGFSAKLSGASLGRIMPFGLWALVSLGIRPRQQLGDCWDPLVQWLGARRVRERWWLMT